jgi:adenylate kinase family enzyme
MSAPGLSPRIAIVGTTGTGKTTLGRQLAQLYQVPFVELDALHWEPNWTGAPVEVFRQRTEEATKGDGWVSDGNYGQVRDIVWAKADTLVWLDYPLHVTMWRLLIRTFRRTLGRETLWNGNRERFWTQFFSRESLFLWALQTFRRRRREYPILLKHPEYSHLKLVRLRSSRETRRWMEGLTDRETIAGSSGSAPGVR